MESAPSLDSEEKTLPTFKNQSLAAIAVFDLKSCFPKPNKVDFLAKVKRL